MTVMSTSRPSQVNVPATHPSGTVVLVSSGLDSTICADREPDATLLFVDFGQAEVEAERQAVLKLFPHVLEVQVGARLAHTGDGVFVPARNLMLACLAVHYGDRIIMGGMKDDRAIDKTPAAFAAMSDILTAQTGYPVTVMSPLFDELKHEAVARYLDESANSDQRRTREARVRDTWSCYGHGTVPCMQCKACFRWAVALRVNGIDVALPSDDIIADYLQRLWIYEPGRQWAILTALRGWSKPVVLVDIDGVLTQETEGRDYANRTPKNAAVLDRLIQDRWIVLSTARAESDRTVTEAWLRQHRFRYHGLLMNKPAGDLLVDDQSTRRLIDLG